MARLGLVDVGRGQVAEPLAVTGRGSLHSEPLLVVAGELEHASIPHQGGIGRDGVQQHGLFGQAQPGPLAVDEALRLPRCGADTAAAVEILAERERLPCDRETVAQSVEGGRRGRDQLRPARCAGQRNALVRRSQRRSRRLQPWAARIGARERLGERLPAWRRPWAPRRPGASRASWPSCIRCSMEQTDLARSTDDSLPRIEAEVRN